MSTKKPSCFSRLIERSLPMNLEQDANPHLKAILKGFAAQKGDFQIRIDGRFESSHFLYRYFPDGSDEPMHGHSWQVEVFLARKDGQTGSDGIALDFLSARKRLDEMIVRLEHVCINNLEEFQNINPTAENIARWFYRGLQERLMEEGGVVREIRVHEGPSNYAIFKPPVSG